MTNNTDQAQTNNRQNITIRKPKQNTEATKFTIESQPPPKDKTNYPQLQNSNKTQNQNKTKTTKTQPQMK